MPPKLATKAVVQLISNASAKIAHLRRRKVVNHINQALMPLLEEDSSFKDRGTSLLVWHGVCQEIKRPCRPGQGDAVYHAY